MSKQMLAIIGTGNIGRAIANGLVNKGVYPADQIILTRRHLNAIEDMGARGFLLTTDNKEAVQKANVVLVAVEPQQVNAVLAEIGTEMEPDRHLLISVVSGISITQISQHVGNDIAVVRAMPNTAIAIGESMTCLASNQNDDKVLDRARAIFDAVGVTLVIDEEQMIPATALGACGIAFFLRAIRAASQGGIEIGFSSTDALQIAAQTAKGAAGLLLQSGNHPEREIDKVTTPRGCTIAGLNQMEHEGFSSAMIRGIITSAEKAAKLYSNG